MGSLDTLVKVLFLQHDEGDEAADPSWLAGDEPAPAVVDTWGRGVVPLKRRLKPLTMEEVQQTGGEAARPASARSGASKKSGVAAVGAGAASKKKEDKKGKKEEKKREDNKAPEEMSIEDKLRVILPPTPSPHHRHASPRLVSLLCLGGAATRVASTRA